MAQYQLSNAYGAETIATTCIDTVSKRNYPKEENKEIVTRVSHKNINFFHCKNFFFPFY